MLALKAGPSKPPASKPKPPSKHLAPKAKASPSKPKPKPPAASKAGPSVQEVDDTLHPIVVATMDKLLEKGRTFKGTIEENVTPARSLATLVEVMAEDDNIFDCDGYTFFTGPSVVDGKSYTHALKDMTVHLLQLNEKVVEDALEFDGASNLLCTASGLVLTSKLVQGLKCMDAPVRVIEFPNTKQLRNLRGEAGREKVGTYLENAMVLFYNAVHVLGFSYEKIGTWIGGKSQRSSVLLDPAQEVELSVYGKYIEAGAPSEPLKELFKAIDSVSSNLIHAVAATVAVPFVLTVEEEDVDVVDMTEDEDE